MPSASKAPRRVPTVQHVLAEQGKAMEELRATHEQAMSEEQARHAQELAEHRAALERADAAANAAEARVRELEDEIAESQDQERAEAAGGIVACAVTTALARTLDQGVLGAAEEGEHLAAMSRLDALHSRIQSKRCEVRSMITQQEELAATLVAVA